MSAHYAIRHAAHDALCTLRTAHANHVWVSPVPFFDDIADAIEAAVSEAGYSITLTDDGAAAPPADTGGVTPTAAESAAPVGAGDPAPSSPLPCGHSESLYGRCVSCGMTWEQQAEERGFVETALAAADAGNAGHWPTVATYLAAEVRRLRAGEGATPAIDREALIVTLHAAGAFCGDCDYEGWVTCEGCHTVLGHYADDVLKLIGGEIPAADFRGIIEAAASLQTAEDIATIAEEYADDLEPPITVEWLELRDWFKDLLHQLAARAREAGGAQ